MMRAMHRTPLILIALLASVAGCGGSSAVSTGPADPSAAPASAEATAPAGACPVIGTWAGAVPEGILRGQTLTMVFAEDNTARGTCRDITLDSTWRLEGDTVEVVDVSSTPPFAQCDASLVGRYTLQFAADCQSVVAISGEDPCGHRRMALLNFRATRQ